VPVTTPTLLGHAAAHSPGLERWFAESGRPPLLDLARSGAPALSVADVLRMAPPDALDDLLGLRLDYDDGAGRASLRHAVASCGAARRGEEVLITHGAVEALLLICAALDLRGRRVLVGTPAYEALLRTPEAVGAQVEPVCVWRAERDTLDLSALHARVEPGIAAVLLNTPANPTGAVATTQDFDAVAERCAEVGAVLVVDEVAVRTLDAKATSACTREVFAAGNVVALGDVSKACGLGGLRVGWLTTASGPLLAAAAALKDLTTVGNAAPSELLASWAVRRREDIVAAVRVAAHSNLETLQRWIAPRTVARLTEPRDGLVALPFLPELATTAAAERLRLTHGVSLVPGELLGLDGYIRVGLGLAPPLFAEALDRVDAALRSPAG
jgi:aspartate/methionine/tyrosine aminotransferase